MRRVKIKVKPKEARIDKYLPKLSKLLSRSKAKKLINEGLVRVNGHAIKPDYELTKGDQLEFEIPPPKSIEVKAENIPIKIVYEDSDLLVVDKQEGMVTHPTIDHPSGTLVNALLYHLKEKNLPGESLRPGIVHRLDKGTSGLMILAKSKSALENLKEQFKSRRVEKRYLTLVGGKLEPPSGTIDRPIARHSVNRKKFTIASVGREAQTDYRVKEYIGDKFSLLLAEPKTGRTHQIRVHFSSVGHPVVGDKLYGGVPAPRIFLHASFLRLRHPKTGENISFESPLPIKLREMIEKYRSTSGKV